MKLLQRLSLPCLLALFWPATLGRSQPGSSHVASRDSGRNVLFLTWDGVRRDEFLGAPDPDLSGGDQAALLPFFWQQLVPRGRVYGDPRAGQVMTVANPALISLPAYESIFAGRTQLIDNNDGPRVADRTFPERLVRELGIASDQVASFASWENLPLAIESQPGTTFTNAGVAPVHVARDEAERELNRAQASDLPPWDDCRYDRYTWQQAFKYLKAKQPRFMYLSFDDADGWGHATNYREYLAAIRRYDAWLKELVTTLDGMGDYGRRTCLVITTDHGRGDHEHWHTHSNGHLYSGLILMYAGCPFDDQRELFTEGRGITTHLDIRPTIEDLFGLTPTACWLCGTSLLRKAASAGL